MDYADDRSPRRGAAGPIEIQLLANRILVRLEVFPDQRVVDQHGERRTGAILLGEVTAADNPRANRIEITRRYLVVLHLNAVLTGRAMLDREIGAPQESLEHRSLDRACALHAGQPPRGLEQPIDEAALILLFTVDGPRQHDLHADGLSRLEPKIDAVQFHETPRQQRRAHE